MRRAAFSAHVFLFRLPYARRRRSFSRRRLHRQRHPQRHAAMMAQAASDASAAAILMRATDSSGAPSPARLRGENGLIFLFFERAGSMRFICHAATMPSAAPDFRFC